MKKVFKAPVLVVEARLSELTLQHISGFVCTFPCEIGPDL